MSSAPTATALRARASKRSAERFAVKVDARRDDAGGRLHPPDERGAGEESGE